MLNDNPMQKHEEPNQKVEHGNLIYTLTVVHLGHSKYVTLGGKRHKVYPTGNPDEPWTTNVSRAVF